MSDRHTDALEKAMEGLFKYEDNNPDTYTVSRAVEKAVKAYVFNPLVKLKRITFSRLHLLLHLGEYIYGMEGKPDEAMYPFEQAVELASRLYPTLKGNPELANAHEWLGRCYLLT
jgi:hypothetical protein